MVEPSYLPTDVHLYIKDKFKGSDCYIAQGKYAYYHYLCDRLDDRGWGCGYRTLQTLCSWIHHQKTSHFEKKVSDVPSRHIKRKVPSICEIQQALVTMEDKPASFLGSKDWIGTVECSMCVDYFYDVPCKIVHVRAGDLFSHISLLCNHFDTIKSPVMMGGDNDASSKGIFGVVKGDTPSSTHLLIVDPHCCLDLSVEALVEEHWVTWRSVDQFDRNSFYNICMPLLT